MHQWAFILWICNTVVKKKIFSAVWPFMFPLHIGNMTGPNCCSLSEEWWGTFTSCVIPPPHTVFMFILYTHLCIYTLIMRPSALYYLPPVCCGSGFFLLFCWILIRNGFSDPDQQGLLVHKKNSIFIPVLVIKVRKSSYRKIVRTKRFIHCLLPLPIQGPLYLPT